MAVKSNRRHRKKPSIGGDKTRRNIWNLCRRFQQARGASVLVNRYAVRRCVDEPRRAIRQGEGNALSFPNVDKGVLVMRGFCGVGGEIAPTCLARVLDPEDASCR